MHFARLLLLQGVALLLAACGGASTEATMQPLAAAEPPAKRASQVEPLEYSPPTHLKAVVPTPARGLRPPPALVHVPPKAQERAAPGRPQGGRLQVGVARLVPATADTASTARLLNWQRGSQASAAAVTFKVEGARGLRVGLLVRKLPAGAVIRGYVHDGATLFEATGHQVLRMLQANRSAGDLSDDGATWWTPIIDGPELTLEIQVPAGTPPDAVEVAVPRISQLSVNTRELLQKNLAKNIGASDTCEIDISCVSDATIRDVGKSVAKMAFLSGGGSFVCTGTLLNNTAQDFTPYFLSANHCISTQTEASTLQTFWFYRSSQCGTLALDSATRTLSSGATLLHASATTDVSFMRLNGAAPAGTTFAGWSASVPSGGVIAVHHPAGDLQKFSNGSVAGYYNCTSDLSCTDAAQASANYARVVWSQGTTEGGSSGSGIFASINGSTTRYLVGQLFGGTASCQAPQENDIYGRFDRAYDAKLADWLSPAPAPASREVVFRFYNVHTGAHFYTLSPLERDQILATSPAFQYEGGAFYVYSTRPSGTSPVYRFYNTVTGRHFFTASEAEKDRVLATMPAFNLEGVGWYAQGIDGGTATELYRFYNNVTATHFFTDSPLERDQLTGNPNSGFAYEGVAYYVWGTP